MMELERSRLKSNQFRSFEGLIAAGHLSRLDTRADCTTDFLTIPPVLHAKEASSTSTRRAAYEQARTIRALHCENAK